MKGCMRWGGDICFQIPFCFIQRRMDKFFIMRWIFNYRDSGCSFAFQLISQPSMGMSQMSQSSPELLGLLDADGRLCPCDQHCHEEDDAKRLHVQYCMIQNKFKELQSKLNSLGPPGEEGEHSQKLKMRSIQGMLAKLQRRFDEENEIYEQKVTGLFDSLRKAENSLKDNANDLEVEETTWASRTSKMEKTLRKAMERVGKERKESDKKLQGALETYLIELTGFKGKAGSSCAASIRELRQLEKDVEALERENKRQSQLSRDIYRKVHLQFSSQIEEIASSLAEEQRQRMESQEHILSSIERMYNALSGAVGEGRRARERQEREVVDLLERVIEKLRYEMASE